MSGLVYTVVLVPTIFLSGKFNLTCDLNITFNLTLTEVHPNPNQIKP